MFSYNWNSVRLGSLGRINLIIGKNGAGKSRLLRGVETDLRTVGSLFLTAYVNPERAGSLELEGGVLTNLQNNVDWDKGQRSQNQVANSRAISFAKLIQLQSMVYQVQDQSGQKADFGSTLSRINSLLETIEFVQDTGRFTIRDKVNQVSRRARDLSSGESEALSLAIEILHFEHLSTLEEHESKMKMLFLDEPDVHLHPDLQNKLMELAADSAVNAGFCVLVATHSTALLSAAAKYGGKVCFMRSGSNDLSFEAITEEIRNVIPVFGAHPLSAVYSERPILIVEGDDDERVWQQAVRSSNGQVKIWPCVAGSVNKQSRHELAASKIISAVYDDAKGYSLRDGDGISSGLSSIGPIERYRLHCYSIESLLLSNEVLARMDTHILDLAVRLLEWLKNPSNQEHDQYIDVWNFSESFDRKNLKLKRLRQFIPSAILGKTKIWEVIVGQTIARVDQNSSRASHSLIDYLGHDFVDEVIL